MRSIDIGVAHSVVCVSVCVRLSLGHTGELCKTAQLIEMPFGGLIRVGARNHALNGGPDLTRGTSNSGSCPPH